MLKKISKITNQTIKNTLSLPKELAGKEKVLNNLWNISGLTKDEVLTNTGKTKEQWEKSIKTGEIPNIFICQRIIFTAKNKMVFQLGRPKEQALFYIKLNSMFENIAEDIIKAVNTYRSALGNQYSSTIKRCGTQTLICISTNENITKRFDTHKNTIDKIHQILYSLGITLEIANNKFLEEPSKETQKLLQPEPGKEKIEPIEEADKARQKGQEIFQKLFLDSQPKPKVNTETQNKETESLPETKKDLRTSLDETFTEYQASWILRMPQNRLHTIIVRYNSKIYEYVRTHPEDFILQTDKTYKITRRGILKISYAYNAANSTTQKKIKNMITDPIYTIEEAAGFLNADADSLKKFVKQNIRNINRDEAGNLKPQKIINNNIYDEASMYIRRSGLQELKELFMPADKPKPEPTSVQDSTE